MPGFDSGLDLRVLSPTVRFHGSTARLCGPPPHRFLEFVDHAVQTRLPFLTIVTVDRHGERVALRPRARCSRLHTTGALCGSDVMSSRTDGTPAELSIWRVCIRVQRQAARVATIEYDK